MSITEENKKVLTRQRRDEITRAAKELFYRNGFTATSMDAIAAQAGISKGLIYHYFQNKEDLLLSFTDSMAEYLNELKQMADPLRALERFGGDAGKFGDIYWSFLLGKLLTVKKGHELEKPEVYVEEILEIFRR